MNHDEMIQVFRHCLDLPQGFVLTEEMSPPQVPGWDSIGWLSVITAFEERMEARFSFRDLEKVYSVGQMFDLVHKTMTKRPKGEPKA